MKEAICSVNMRDENLQNKFLMYFQLESGTSLTQYLTSHHGFMLYIFRRHWLGLYISPVSSQVAIASVVHGRDPLQV